MNEKMNKDKSYEYEMEVIQREQQHNYKGDLLVDNKENIKRMEKDSNISLMERCECFLPKPLLKIVRFFYKWIRKESERKIKCRK